MNASACWLDPSRPVNATCVCSSDAADWMPNVTSRPAADVRLVAMLDATSTPISRDVSEIRRNAAPMREEARSACPSTSENKPRNSPPAVRVRRAASCIASGTRLMDRTAALVSTSGARIPRASALACRKLFRSESRIERPARWTVFSACDNARRRFELRSVRNPEVSAVTDIDAEPMFLPGPTEVIGLRHPSHVAEHAVGLGCGLVLVNPPVRHLPVVPALVHDTLWLWRHGCWLRFDESDRGRAVGPERAQVRGQVVARHDGWLLLGVVGGENDAHEVEEAARREVERVDALEGALSVEADPVVDGPLGESDGLLVWRAVYASISHAVMSMSIGSETGRAGSRSRAWNTGRDSGMRTVSRNRTNARTCSSTSVASSVICARSSSTPEGHSATHS